MSDKESMASCAEWVSLASAVIKERGMGGLCTPTELAALFMASRRNELLETLAARVKAMQTSIDGVRRFM